MTSLFESAWVIARRDFVATVYSRSFILFLIVPLLVMVGVIGMMQLVDETQRDVSQPVVAVVADGATVEALQAAHGRLSAGTPEGTFPVLQSVDPAEDVSVQARRLLANEEAGYSAVFSGTLERPVLTGPLKVDETVGRRMSLIVEDARRSVALSDAGIVSQPAELDRVITDQAAGNLQMIRRDMARAVISVIFFISILLATLMLSNLAEEKSNKVIEVLAAAVPLDAVFLGKLIAMLGISFVGLALWGGVFATAYLFTQVVQDWVTLPQAGPAIGWAGFGLLVLLYYGTNFMLLGSLFLGIGAQASNLRDIQTLTMPVTLIQTAVFLLAVTVIGSEGGVLTWIAYIFPFSSPLAMVSSAASSSTLWIHLPALAWQALWVVLIIRLSARWFRMTVLKSAPGGAFFSFAGWRRARVD